MKELFFFFLPPEFHQSPKIDFSIFNAVIMKTD